MSPTYVALPFMQDDDGTPTPATAEECQSSAIARRRAETMSRMPGSIGAVAFSRTGDPRDRRIRRRQAAAGPTATCRRI